MAEQKDKRQYKTIIQSKQDIENKINPELDDDGAKNDLCVNARRTSNNYEVISVNINPRTMKLNFLGYIKILKPATVYQNQKKYSILYVIQECSSNVLQMFDQMTNAILDRKKKGKKPMDPNTAKDTSFGRVEERMSVFLDKMVLFNLQFSNDKILYFTSDDLIKKYKKNKHIIDSFFTNTMLIMTAQPQKITIPDKNVEEDITTKITLTNFKCRLSECGGDLCDYEEMIKIFRSDGSNGVEDNETKFYKKKQKKQKEEIDTDRDSNTSESE